jgi:putative transposase
LKRSRYTEFQIVKILKEVEAGRLVKEVCREYGISDATYYNWKSKYGGMEASEIKRLKELEDENRQLKQMYAELSLEHKILKDIIEKSCKANDSARAGRPCQTEFWGESAPSLSCRWHQ